MPYDKPISYSGMSLYEDCPRLWHHRYILGNRGESNAAAERGTLLHAQLEEYFKGNTPYPGTDKCLGPWKGYMEKLFLQNPSPEEEVAVDSNWQPVAFDAPNAYFRGKKDLDIKCDSHAEIYDWKSGKIYPSHVSQGKAYLALSPYDCDFIVRFVYLDIPTHVEEWKYKEEDKIREREILTRKIEVIRLDETWRPTPGEKCRWCDLSWRRGGDCTAAY
jgi:hypothetical protein